MTIHDEIVEPWIYTYSGQQVDLFDPDPGTIKLVDIAHALANIGRWGGHTGFYWSVAQHSVLVSQHCHTDHAMVGLFHDAAEAYLGDICRPLKRSPFLRDYRFVYKNMEQVILKKFCGIDYIPESVHKADEAVLATEAVHLMNRQLHTEDREWLCDGEPLDIPLQPSMPQHAKQAFLQRHYRLTALNK